MKKVKYNKVTVAGIFCITALVSLLGIFGPGTLLHSADILCEDQVENVPDAYYSASKTAMARNNSKRMKVSEKLQLISGQWESTVMEANDYEMSSDNYEAVQMAKDELSKMYQMDLYPSMFSEEYGNWYSWDAKCYKAVDGTFKTYTAYYWEINLNKYDGSERHIIYTLDDGTLFFAKAWYNKEMDISSIANAYDVKDIDGEETKVNFDVGQISDWISYPNTDTSNMKWKALSCITLDDEEYSIVQGYTENEYLYSFTSLPTEENN